MEIPLSPLRDDIGLLNFRLDEKSKLNSLDIKILHSLKKNIDLILDTLSKNKTVKGVRHVRK